jgi:tRNA pseudouridine55 synthase
MLWRVFGFFNINKAPGPTSHDVVDAVRRMLPRRTKVGHAGTLDPFADGVLVLCVGPATRLADYVQAQEKRYIAQITLGATSDTDDSTGRITPASPPAAAPGEPAVRAAVERMVGAIEQVPPAHSAVHVEGRRAYELARRGQSVALRPRQVTVYSMDVLEYEFPQLRLDIRCAGGTYIRAIARDIGASLGVGGYCSALTRAAIGAFALEQSVRVESLVPSQHLIDPLAAAPLLPRVPIGDYEIRRRLITGSEAVLDEPLATAGQVAVTDIHGKLLALATVGSDRRTIRPDRVFERAG